MSVAFTAGFALSLGLILAIGAQNAFVLRQGLRGEHVTPVVVVCCLSEALLIATGVAGFEAFGRAVPWALEAMRWGGVAFLVVYGARALKAALAGEGAMRAEGAPGTELRQALGAALAITWANPHVYLDTVGLIGAVAAQYRPDHWAFGAGALAASCLFFAALGYGARLLAPVFGRPAAWRVLDAVVGATMLGLAAKLALGA
ncbi:LysE/ArgO family amino acid transporter [Roseibacterium sp. SDUM158017]|uniref:LysE/ArgO family amino acid transporter n=1 Tax=Roseicyclus salinarum TaxID=3036773 RepID=UPI002414EE82|nr:LysE/ArgO family amino acid transporter [Roseibacterium sp. SDUM158017]MDG4647473.1 LysE/ArgO family amino acid transporter [Roseibacterium sp. SDUM158017]